MIEFLSSELPNALTSGRWVYSLAELAHQLSVRCEGPLRGVSKARLVRVFGAAPALQEKYLRQALDPVG